MTSEATAVRRKPARSGSMSLLSVELLIVIAVFVGVYGIVGTAPAQLTIESLYRLSWLNNAVLVVQIIVLRKSFGSLTAPVVLYAVFLSLFTSGQLILFSIGVEPSGADVLNREAAYSVARATAFYLTAFTLFCAGCLLTNEVKRNKPAREGPTPTPDDWQRSLLSVGGVCLVVGLVPFLVSNYHNFRVVLTEGYSGYYAEGARLESPLLSLSYLFITGLVFVGCAGRPRARDAAAGTLVAIALMRLAAGDSGEGMIYLLSGYLLRTQFARSDSGKRIMLVLIFAFALLAIPAVGLMRQSFGGGTGDLGTALQQDNPLETTLGTIGGTLFPLVSVVELVPAAVPYAAGATYLSSVTRLMPEILHAGPLADIAADPLYSSPATWLMNYRGMSYGPGFTPFAEAYLNFGWWAGCLALLLYGVLTALLLRLPNKASTAWPFRTALVLATFALLGFTVRGSFNLVVPFLFWYVFLPGVPVVLFAHRFRRKREGVSKVRNAH